MNRKRKTSESTHDNVSKDNSSNSDSDDTVSTSKILKIKKKETVVRKWNEDYLKFGFFMTEEEKIGVRIS